MESLTFEESWTLFCLKTFKDKCCPAHLKTVVEGIVGKCEGLPLTIAAISGLLASKGLSRISEWEQILRSLQDEFEGTGKLDRAKKTLRLSYDDLPSTLKTCLLYTSIFPEDHKIGCSRLISMWIAERFVEQRAELTAEEVGRDYIKQLSNRSLIQVSEEVHGGLPFYFHIHDLLREVIVSESDEQNMISIVSKTGKRWPPEKVVRRLVIQSNLLDVATRESHRYFNTLRSIITFGRIKPPSKASRLTKLLSNKLLKVLNFEGMLLEEIPKEIFNLFHLNYLNVSRTRVKIVPKSIERLQNLEHFDLSETNVTELPVEIIKLQKLRYLSVYPLADSLNSRCDGFKAPCKMGNLLELETLEKIDAGESDKTRISNEIGKLTQLRRLGITNLRKEDGKELCSSLENLTNLREFGVASSIEEILDLNHSLSALSLQYVWWLSLMGRLEKLPPWIRNLQRLETINLIWSNLMDDPLESLQHFPNLTEVYLSQAYQGESLCFRAGGFPKLKKLHLRNMKELKWVRVEEGSISRIEQLFLQDLPLLEEVPLGIEHLSQLQELELRAVSSQLTTKLGDEVFKESEDYEKIARIPQVLIVFQKDGTWWKHQLSRKEKTPI